MRRVLLWGGGLLLAAGVVAALMLGPGAIQMAQVGAGYVARQTCSCLFVAGRDFDSCRSDMLPEMDRIEAVVLEDPPGVAASLFGLAERRALHHPGRGCTLY